MSIHPTAFVDPQAQIADDVEVGPFAVVEAGAKIGRGCILHGHAQVLAFAELGENCQIGHSTIVGASPQDLKFDHATPSGVRLGSGNVLREHVTIHRSSKEGGVTVIGQDNYFMVGSHVGHDCLVGDRNILANHCLLGGHVILGNSTFLGGGSAFHQFVRIGNLCMVKGLAAISQDVPPYVMASHTNQIRGLNVVGMRRAGLSAATRKNVKDAFHQMYLAGLNLKDALASTDEREWETEAVEFIDFFRVPTSRGICHPG